MKMNNIEWDIKVPIFKNRLILKQLGLALGIPFGLLLIVMMIVQAYYGAIMIAATLLLTLIIVMIVFRGTYDLHIKINEKGILYKNQNDQAKRIKSLSILTFIMGLFAKNPSSAGAGLLAGSRTELFIKWKSIRKTKYIDKQKLIMIKGGFAQNIALFCTEENFSSIKKYIIEKTT